MEGIFDGCEIFSCHWSSDLLNWLHLACSLFFTFSLFFDPTQNFLHSRSRCSSCKSFRFRRWTELGETRKFDRNSHLSTPDCHFSYLLSLKIQIFRFGNFDVWAIYGALVLECYDWDDENELLPHEHHFQFFNSPKTFYFTEILEIFLHSFFECSFSFSVTLIFITIPLRCRKNILIYMMIVVIRVDYLPQNLALNWSFFFLFSSCKCCSCLLDSLLAALHFKAFSLDAT